MVRGKLAFSENISWTYSNLSAAEGRLKGLFQSDECKNRLTKIWTNNTKIKCKKVLGKYVRMTKSSNKVVIEGKEKTPQGASKNYLLVSYIAYFYIWIDIIGSVIWNIARMFSVVFWSGSLRAIYCIFIWFLIISFLIWQNSHLLNIS